MALSGQGLFLAFDDAIADQTILLMKNQPFLG
jgi:hypothetical protein